jgi:hypothetical protein
MIRATHAGEAFHGGRPVHVPIAHQGEVRVDAFRREGLGQCFMDGQVVL